MPAASDGSQAGAAGVPVSARSGGPRGFFDDSRRLCSAGGSLAGGITWAHVFPHLKRKLRMAAVGIDISE
jgi:hypothetical protein